MRPGQTTIVSRTRDQRGVVLPLTLFMLLVLTVLATALLGIGGTEVFIAGNHLRGTQALFVAEAGLEHAFDLLRVNASLVSPATPVTSLTAVPGLPSSGTSVAGIGSYVAQYRSIGTDTVEVVATGTTTVGAGVRILRATLTTAFESRDAVRTKDDLTISGNPTIAGACGSVHTNSDLDISGNPNTSGKATATGTYKASGSPTVGEGSGGGKSRKPIPPIVPSDILLKAKASVATDQLFQLKSDGRVLDGNDNVIATLAKGDNFNGWKYEAGSPTKWDLSGNTAGDGTYYLEGNAKVSGNPGSATTPWHTSIIATGDVDISGNPEITTHFGDTLIIAGGDVKMSGNPSQGFTGLIGAHEQIDISGNASITGFVIAEDAASASNSVKQNKISGNPTITYDCGLNNPLTGLLRILSWGS